MKTSNHTKDIYTSENDIIYTIENGLTVRDVTVNAGIGEEIYIGHLSDLHFNYCNKQDFDEANPVVMSTYENRKWLANAQSVPTIRRCLEYIDDVDHLVISGDVMDYLSYGCMELMQKEIWDKYPDVLVPVGGHEFLRKMQGVVDDPSSRESRMKIIADFWKHDIYYETKLVKDKVLLIGLLNDEGVYTADQEEKLKKDIELAREKGYIILIFQHEPICSNNPKHISYGIDEYLTQGDIHDGKPKNFCDGVKLAGSVFSDEQTMKVYKLIANNADVIKAVFSGHLHNDMSLEILGSYPNGEKAYIPQYVHTASAYDMGHLMRIIVK